MIIRIKLTCPEKSGQYQDIISGITGKSLELTERKIM
jgi:hypothetical protein